MTWPLWIGGGVSFRPFEGLLLSADVQWTRWSDPVDAVVRGPPNHDLPGSGLDALHARVLDEVYYFGLPDIHGKDTTQLRFGVE